MKVRLNDDLLELMTDAGDTWRTITDTLQHLHGIKQLYTALPIAYSRLRPNAVL